MSAAEFVIAEIGVLVLGWWLINTIKNPADR